MEYQHSSRARIQEFLPGGGGSKPDCHKTALTFFLVLNLFLRFNSGLFQRKLLFFKVSEWGDIFQGGEGQLFSGGGDPTFSTGDP